MRARTFVSICMAGGGAYGPRSRCCASGIRGDETRRGGRGRLALVDEVERARGAVCRGGRVAVERRWWPSPRRAGRFEGATRVEEEGERDARLAAAITLLIRLACCNQS